MLREFIVYFCLKYAKSSPLVCVQSCDQLSRYNGSYSVTSYLVVAELRVYDEDVTGSPKPGLFIPSIAEVTVVEVVRGLHRDQPEESPVVGTTGAEGELLSRIGSQDLAPVAAQTHTVMHDLEGNRHETITVTW